MYQLVWGCGGVHVKLWRLVFCACPMITIKVIVIPGGMTLTSHSGCLIIKGLCRVFICLPVFSNVLQRALVFFDVIQPHTETVFFPSPSSQLTCFLSWRRNAISLWSKYPHRLPLSPVKMTFRKMSFRPCYAVPLPQQGGIILLVKWSFRQCGAVSIVLHLAREALKGYTSVSCCQLPVVVSSFLLHKQVKRKRREDVRRPNWSHVFNHEWGD